DNQAIIFRFKKDFVKWRSAKRKDPPEDHTRLLAREAELCARGYSLEDELAFARRVMARVDEEAALRAGGAGGPAHAALVAELDEVDAYLTQRLLHKDARGWVSLHQPHTLDYQNLVALRRPDAALPALLVGPDATRRRRDGFRLTDPRMTPREVASEIDYCIY